MISNKQYNAINAGIAYIIGNMLIKGIPFFTLPIFTRLLSTSDFGIYNLFISYENILAILLGFGLYGTIRIAKVEYEEHFEDYITSIIGAQITLALICYLLLFVIYSVFYSNGWMNTKIFIILLIYCLSSQIYNIASAKYAINGSVKTNLFLSFIVTFMNISISLFLCIFVYKDETYFGRILGTCIASCAVMVIVILLQIKQSRHLYNKKYWIFGLKMGSPLILHSLSLILLSNLDKIMINYFEGPSLTGIYSVAVNLSTIIIVLITSVDNAWAPWFYNSLKNKKYKSIRKNNDKLIIAFSLLTCIIITISPELIKIVAPPDYFNSIYSLIPLLIAITFNFYYIIPVNLQYFYKKTKFIAFSTMLTLLFNIVLNIILINQFGYIGAAISTCLSRILLFILNWRRAWIIKKVILFNRSLLLKSIVFILLFGAITLLARNNAAIRYTFLSFILIYTINYFQQDINSLHIFKK